MKTLMKYLMMAFVCLTAAQSCQMIEDDVFDVDPATRQDTWMAEYRRVFNNNKYGWALYTNQPTLGRHPSVKTFAVRFDSVNSTFYKSSSTVRLPAPLNTLDSVVSQYSFKMDNGIVLSFDTYNAFFHWYSDQSQFFAQDLQGDFEFCLDRFSANEDTIFGRGKTKQLPFMMIKMQVPPEEYQQQSDQISGFAAFDCVMICAGDTLRARFLSGYQNLLVYFPDEEGGPDVEHMYSYGNLPNGIYLMENFKYKGVTVVEMDLDRKTGEFADRMGQAKIGPLPLVNYLLGKEDNEDWFFGYSGLETYTKGEWDKARKAIDGSGKFKADGLENITLLPDGKGGVSLLVNKWYGDGEIYYHLEARRVSDDEVALRYTGHEITGLSYSPYDNGLKYIVDALAGKDKWTTYKITYRGGNPMSPGGFVFTDESNPANSYYFEPDYHYNHNSIWE